MTKTNSRVKKTTRRAVYNYLRDHPQATRSEISAALTLSVPTVSKYLRHLVETGLAEEQEKLRPGEDGGRAPASYAVLPTARIAVGISITKRGVTAVAVDVNGTTLGEERIREPFERSAQYTKTVGGLYTKLLSSLKLDPAAVLGVGLAMPGLVDMATNTVFYGRVLDNEGMCASDFQPFFDSHVALLHDSYAAGLAELWHWDHIENAFYIYLSGSVGGAVLFENRIFAVEHGYPGEIGHLLLDPQGKQCYCGRYGCMDTVCSSSALIEGNADSVEQFFAELPHNKKLQKAWQGYVEKLTRAIHSVRSLFGGIVILGGEIGGHMGDHLSDVLLKVDEGSLFGERAADYVVPTRQRTASVATGAALFFIQQFLRNPTGN